MSDHGNDVEVSAAKDEAAERPIPTAWRPALRSIVAAFMAADFRLEAGVDGVEPVDAETAAQVRDYLRDYGAVLVPLPDETWKTSVCLWSGSHWDALVDLWTQAEGRSDLVLHVRVFEKTAGVGIAVHLVYVP